MPWGKFYPSQLLFLPCHSSAKTCWETTTLVETGKNQYSLNSPSFPHLFKQCSSLFSPACFNPYNNYIIFLSVHLVTILWLKQSSKANTVLFICSHFKKQTSIPNGIPGLQQTCAHFMAIPLFREIPLIWSFPRAEVKHFSSKEDPLWQLLNYVLKLLITSEQHMPKAYTGVLILN